MASDREENLEIREDACVICKKNDETENSSKLIEVRQKGIDTLKVYCRKRKQDVTSTMPSLADCTSNCCMICQMNILGYMTSSVITDSTLYGDQIDYAQDYGQI